MTALSLSRSELPEEIATAIEAFRKAEQREARLEPAREPGPWADSVTACRKAKEALTAAILSRLGEAEATEKELATLRRVHRWNVEHSDGEVLVCRNNHDKGDDCDWERFVPEERLTAALARVERLEKALVPFAEAADNLEGNEREDQHLWESPEAMMLSVKDLRAARSALSD